ncbi:hypothetical protein C5N14_27685 [Micromonospora sp. MW-13]|nr:hypothetical protein C5N14_27685 [Micromonospora sp. MW-13]
MTFVPTMPLFVAKARYDPGMHWRLEVCKPGVG